jgi:hypothetical protein
MKGAAEAVPTKKQGKKSKKYDEDEDEVVE